MNDIPDTTITAAVNGTKALANTKSANTGTENALAEQAGTSTGIATAADWRHLKCSCCGASVTAACDCGAAYIPAGTLAARAVAAHPEKSDRALAAEIGVDHKTIAKARQAGGDNSPPETRVGRDGKRYAATRAVAEPRLNAIGKPFSPSYDPKYRVRHGTTSISRLFASQDGFHWKAEADDDRKAAALIARLGREDAVFVLETIGKDPWPAGRILAALGARLSNRPGTGFEPEKIANPVQKIAAQAGATLSDEEAIVAGAEPQP